MMIVKAGSYALEEYIFPVLFPFLRHFFFFLSSLPPSFPISVTYFLVFLFFSSSLF